MTGEALVKHGEALGEALNAVPDNKVKHVKGQSQNFAVQIFFYGKTQIKIHTNTPVQKGLPLNASHASPPRAGAGLKLHLTLHRSFTMLHQQGAAHA
ncbi:hypothetical protein [Deinococcus cellulosilyticus]|uniref:hypothetical protein n=1 Tax=Deinococcus cellulosilyticus TaxID=401558 RepID=UPI0011BDE056|nr:hypothetical protein [Deinococcus cellulosilyticus]